MKLLLAVTLLACASSAFGRFVLHRCEVPSCATPEDRQKLWPTCNPSSYFQCEPNAKFSLKSCAASNEKFNFYLQSCVSDWHFVPTCLPCAVQSVVGGCPVPTCGTAERDRLSPHPNPNSFYQCHPTDSGDWKAIEMPCSGNLRFQSDIQVCDFPGNWKDECAVGSTPQATTPKSTTVNDTLMHLNKFRN